MPSSPHRDAVTYDRISGPLERIGNEVLGRLELAGDETVLDAGCGSGRVTQGLVARLPRGRVICVDGSPEMLAVARDRLGPAVEYVLQDLADLELGGRLVDAVLSTATLHWLPDHPRVFARLRAVLRPGGRLVAQCGGTGNTAELVAAAGTVGDREPFDVHLGGWPGPWNFVGPGETTARLRDAGFTDVSAWLVRRPAPYDELGEWLRANALTAHLERLPVGLREPFVEAVAAELGRDPEISYIRLNIDAARPPGEA
ncbi:MAG TPA: methyltransferase domain-containing protein [Solirubrobacteraceae bacterium]|jgi:trans-aconitate 2-methyltransferase|nr:methyltransferase domain-containing protein [Solirubrobacteraceae bacterium]